jgi:subfamily B ATP-binding cassette protein MsbA
VQVNNNQIHARPNLSSIRKLVIELVLPYRHWLLLIFISMLLETAMSLAAPWPLKIIIDSVIDNKELPHNLAWLSQWFPEAHSMRLAATCGVALVIITSIGGIVGYIDNYFTESVAQYMANDLRTRTYSHLQHLSLAYYDTHKVGELVSTITTDVNTIQDFVSATLLTILVDILTIAGMFGLMFYLRWDFALISIAMTPFLLLFVIRFRRAVKKATHEVRRDQAELVTVLQQGLESIRAVNVFGRQEFEENKLEKVSMETVHAALRARRIKSLVSPVFTLGVSICTGLVIWRGAHLVLTDVMTIGALTVFLSYMTKFFSPVKDLGKMTVSIAQATVALERIQQLLNANMTVPEKANAHDPGRLKGNIQFENVNFSYTRDVPVLKEINLTIHEGEQIGICGPTGSGKSTLASLIPRLYDCTSGKIVMDGHDITDFTLTGLRREIGFVLQDTMLFHGTIYNNIAYGRPEASRAEIIEAARLANADEFISKLPMGYDTLVGERGVTLSGGERQRIGIARALVRNAPILILDEPTASLDAESERIVLDALHKLMKGRTVIIISHRLNTLIEANKILVLKDGMIVESGKHSELLKKNGVYAELYRVFNMTKNQ